MEIIKKTLVVLILCSFIIGTVPISVLAQLNSPEDQIFEYEGPDLSSGVEYVPGELIVKFKPWVSNKEIGNINSIHGTSVKYTSPYAGFKVLHVPNGKTVSEMVEIYNKNPNVEYAEPDYIAYASMVPNDPLYRPYQWHLDIPVNEENSEWHGVNGGGINIEPAWDLSRGSGVTVAVIDTGVAYENHSEFVNLPGRFRDYWITYAQAPDLAGTCFVQGYDFVNDDLHPNDDAGHGTHVTGTIAQNTNNSLGVAGIAFDSCIMPVKVLGSDGIGTYADIIDGILYAVNNGANVISMSLGGSSPSIALEDALEYAYNEGVTIIASSGNNGAETIGYPAAYDAYVIAVGATRYDEARAPYSSYYSVTNDPVIRQYVDITAPGGDTSVNQNGDGYGDGVLQQTHDGTNYETFGYYLYQGTSMAAPHVSGVAALIIANNIATTPDEVRNVLESTAEDKGSAGWDPEYGHGIVDAYAALQWIPDDTPVNNSPEATDDDYSVEEDTILNVEEALGVLKTDSDVENDPLTTVLASGVSNGNLTLNSNGSFTYEPNDDFTGIDSFTYKANDGFSDSNIATVNITVNPVNDVPVADNQTVTTQKGSTVEIVLTGGDVDDGDVLAYIIDSGPSHGALIGNAPNMIYTPISEYIGDDSFTFKVNDGEENSSLATVTIIVTEAELTMHIAGIDMDLSNRRAGRNTFTRAIAIVTIVDANEEPVSGATVSGHWSIATPDFDSDMTDTNGNISLYSDEVKNAPSETNFTFTVDYVVGELTYNPDDNIETTDNIVV
jgi:serine protease